MNDQRRQRHEAFQRIFAALPGRKIDRIRRVASVTGCKEHTVRIYLLQTENVHVPSQLAIDVLMRYINEDKENERE